jgi:hypothetical protein
LTAPAVERDAQPMAKPDDPNALIAELPRWNNGAGIDALSWIGCVGNFELAIGYSLIFWPRFVVVEDHVLRAGTTPDRLDAWRKQPGCERAGVEAMLNHLHIVDLHAVGEAVTEAQVRYLGRVLKAIHEVKLRADFPDRRFEVEFNDEPGLELLDYQLTFWQVELGI